MARAPSGQIGSGGQAASGRSRRLSPDEVALWAQVAQSVTPLPGRRRRVVSPAPEMVPAAAPAAKVPPKPPRGRVPPPLPPPAPPPPAPRPLDRHGLDANWDRRLGKGAVAPDFTLDLHGASLDAAHARLEHGLTLAAAQGARVVLVITGRPRPYDGPADRGSQRGAIRAKLLDWLAHGSHAGRIAAVRAAHPRHGGAGAVYVVLRKAA